MPSTPDFVQHPISWLIVVGAGALGWMGKAWRSDSREVREMLRTDAKENREAILALQREQSEALHATAAALDRNTEQSREKDRLIQENTAALHRIESLLRSSSGQP
jgi:Sec-independent protein translocase protein TatA